MLYEASKMTEQICLKWNDFQENVNAAFGNLGGPPQGGNKFGDVTLAFEDGHRKVILADQVHFSRTRSKGTDTPTHGSTYIWDKKV